ncbi:MAG TPA: head GIN domain-containing protein [Chitinophagaceae bacterium]|nr:DUF2807 domain-containing protein [Chitinophagaceae bacterium]MCB9056786.1 DUF2807 domain-containing protein [Chitinophagales bacterium]HPG12079.1 head GIN domain-containing protein [Chitinophagaceae bacterium]
MRKISYLFFLPVVFLVSCSHVFKDRVKGNGSVKTENRQITDFTKVRVSGAIDLFIKQDSATSVSIVTDENLMEFIETINENGSLIIKPVQGYSLSGTNGIKVYVSSPVYNRFNASGACEIKGENKIYSDNPIKVDLSGSSHIEMDIKAPEVNADASGSCSVSLSGETRKLAIDGSGSTSVYCKDLKAENVEVGISGAGNAEVYASVDLNVRVSGSGSIRYWGNARVNQHISGSGSVTKAE